MSRQYGKSADIAAAGTRLKLEGPDIPGAELPTHIVLGGMALQLTRLTPSLEHASCCTRRALLA